MILLVLALLSLLLIWDLTPEPTILKFVLIVHVHWTSARTEQSLHAVELVGKAAVFGAQKWPEKSLTSWAKLCQAKFENSRKE